MQTTVEDKESGNNVAAVNCYFMSQDGSMFKAQVHFYPLLVCADQGAQIIHSATRLSAVFASLLSSEYDTHQL